MSKNIIVAGLGHGGIVAAALLAEAGFNVTVYEKKSEGTLGYDWTDMFDPKSLDFAGIPMPPKDKFKFKEDMTFCGPSSKKFLTQYIPERRMEIIMERKDIYNHLISFALEKGVKIVYDCEVSGPILIGDRVVGIKTSKGQIMGDLIIDSCGINSPVRRNLPKKLGICNEIADDDRITIYRAFYNKCSDAEVKEKFKIVLFAGGKPGLSWVASHEEYTDVLIGRFKSFSECEVQEFTDFLRRSNPRLGKERIRGGQFVDIPVRHGLSVMVADGYAAIGDCACMPVPLIGSGIANSIRAAKILADTVIGDKTCFYNAEALWSYQLEYFSTIGAFLAPLECVKRGLLKLTAQDVDYCFESEIITSDDMKIVAQLTKTKESFEILKKEVVKKLKGIKGHTRLVSVAFGVLAKMGRVLAISSRIPRKWDRKKIVKWADSYDKAFK